MLKFMDNDVKKISGGELQRVAIAATLLKDANVFIFDEPTSYLDIKQRLRVAKIIKDLANETTAVMVVEHDLIILDYLTDLVHITYGTEGGYGVVSQTKATRVGINEYLEGYMREENIRFRGKKITFETVNTSLVSSPEILVSWNKIKKKLGLFNLTAEEGKITKKELVGVLGENGIGKTSFVKVLANVLEPDEGNVEEDIKVSYKPQYIESNNEVVRIYLEEALKYELQLIRPLIEFKRSPEGKWLGPSFFASRADRLVAGPAAAAPPLFQLPKIKIVLYDGEIKYENKKLACIG